MVSVFIGLGTLINFLLLDAAFSLLLTELFLWLAIIVAGKRIKNFKFCQEGISGCISLFFEKELI